LIIITINKLVIYCIVTLTMEVTKLFFITSTLSFLFLAAYSAPTPSRLIPVKSTYFLPTENMAPSDINAECFTHIFFAFLVPNNTTFTFDITPDLDHSLQDFTSTLKAKNPQLRVLFSIGGGDIGPSLFSYMASNPDTRSAFIKSSIDVARKYGFDGFDLDYEFPQNASDMANLGQLLKEWRAAVKHEKRAAVKPEKRASGKKKQETLLITAAVYYAADISLSGPPRSYPAAQITKYLDWVNMMDYDLKGSWDTSATGEHAQLYDATGGNLSVSYGVDSWIQAGVPPHMLVMGLPLYGKTWELKSNKVFEIGAPAVGVGPGADGIMTYSEVVDFIKKKKKKVKVYYDNITVSMYAVASKDWIGYDDVPSVTAKLQYALDKKLRGYFFWTIPDDDKNWTISCTASNLWTG
ncbi:chitinase, partial [Striga asiatica]